jgi:demethylmenaquinone methyltransferase/2-methoxy-6-polyprenyl-1,4-benzoquinol methylase
MAQVLPYNTGVGGKKEEVRDMFDNISSTYDGLNRVLSFGIDQGWRRKLIARLKKHNPNRVLDVATGTADLAIAEAKATKAEVIGLDLSEGMLAVGRKKVASRQLQERVLLVQGDSEALPYPDAHFDAVTVAFGVRNFENLELGLAEIRRVLRPNGLLLVLEFGRPKSALVRAVYNFYSFQVLPFMGKLVSRDACAYSYLPESVRVFPSGSDFVQILHRVGFVTPACTSLTFGICMLYEGSAP